MLQFFFSAAFSAIPLTLYVPPPRHLNLFVGTLDEILHDSRPVYARVYPRACRIWSWILRHVFCIRRRR
ncbi:hypothetical protein L484_012524 [Morus notabilis]|uniref:Uncharacterized protein n=1 Tax=Morus notabilis TaxID=981085 RepID=W9QFD9_9ROSA|nr:hypothetical protein L484_012524 [Morus notabilis]